jgi:hypothetical protein
MLLHDVSLRLDDQYAVCDDLLASLNRMHQQHHTMDRCTTRVVRAVNSPVHPDWKQAMQQQQEFKLITEKAQKDLNNLKRLHKDTAHLACGLIDETSSVMNRFNDADWHSVFSTVEQIRSRHASTVETLADIVISLRRIHAGEG